MVSDRLRADYKCKGPASDYPIGLIQDAWDERLRFTAPLDGC